ncbi:MAG: EAL domain-containing protein [Saccharofermentans sp.]|nr:EAL domain-containing protein [Saccharofermentans sp.]
MGILVILAINSSSSAISNWIENTVVATGGLFAVQYATQMLLFLSHNLLAPAFTFYIMLVNGKAIHTNRKVLIGFSFPMVVLQIFTISNPWTNFIFYYDANADYVRGSLFWIVYVVSAIYLIAAIYYMVKYREVVSRETNMMLWLFFAFSIIGVVVQAIFPELKIELYAECLSSIGIMLSIEEERDLIDASSRMYNRRAFMIDNKRLIATNHNYAVIAISITNIRLFVHILNYKAMSDSIVNITKWLMRCSKNAILYRISTGNLALIYTYDDISDVENLVEKIRQRFVEGWEYDGDKLDFNVQIRYALVPEYTNKPSSLLDLAEDFGDIDRGGVNVATKDEVMAIVEKGNIESMVKDALKNDYFEVYYQPIWGVKENKYVSAEALIRLKTPSGQTISPAVFIPIAEKTGHIGQLGMLVFDKVCKFISSEECKALGLRYIDINLSLYQLVVGDVPQKFDEIMKKYGVTPNMINLEITESAQIEGQGTIAAGIGELKDVGFKFSLDDFGTGYANISDMVAMRFDCIKSDKGLLWDSATNSAAKNILCSYIKIIRNLGIDLVQEGVESKEQLDLVTRAGANYIQGYYFCRPLPMNEFIEFVRNAN